MPVPFGGTSCAAPWLSGMLATYYSGLRVPPVAVVRELIAANSRDLEEAGRDRKSGYGFFVLPEVDRDLAAIYEDDSEDLAEDPVENPGEDPEESEGTEIILHIGSFEAMVNGRSVALDCVPFVSEGRTFVPLRFIAEALGCTVDYANGVITIRA